MVEERVKLPSLNQRRVIYQTEGRLLLLGQRNLGRCSGKKQSREQHTKNRGKLGFFPPRKHITPPALHFSILYIHRDSRQTQQSLCLSM